MVSVSSTSIAATGQTEPASIPKPQPWRAVWSLCWREIIRFFRQRNRVMGAVGQPLLFWFLLSVGLNRSFDVPGQDFGQYYLPGTLVLILLFTAIFATISIIEDRKEGFLQAVLVAPVPRWATVLGKILGGSAIALLQSLIFLLLALTLGVRPGLLDGLAMVLLLALVAVELTSLGFIIAWRLDSTQGFHAIMNLLLMPMWLLSGAFFPIPSLQTESTWAEVGMHWVMRCNPVTYAVSGIRHLMFPGMWEKAAGANLYWLPSLPLCWLLSVVFAVLMFLAAGFVARRHTSGDLL